MQTQLVRRIGTAAIAAALAAGLLGAAGARAAAPPPELQQMATAIGALHSYKLTEDVATTGTAQGSPFSNAHVVAVIVYKGKFEESHITMTVKSGANSQLLLEAVTTTKHSCARGLLVSMFSSSKADSQKWVCGKQAASLGASVPGTSQITSNLNGYTFVPVGQRTVQGQLCDGYHMSKKTATDKQSGTLWIAAATHLLVEVDLVETKTDTPSSKPATSTMKLVMSNYNDPSLTIPNV